MKVRVTLAQQHEKQIVANLMRLYRHDLSEFSERETVDSQGLFRLGRFFDDFWTAPERDPYLIRVDGGIAGFALVSRIGSYMSMSEFFVLRGLRRSGVGLSAAKDIIMRYPGCWRIHELGSNLPAQRFWRRVAKEITRGTYVEDDSSDQGPTQVFEIV